MPNEKVLDLARNALEDLKARDLVTLDVRSMTSVTDYLLIASGTSDRHVRSLAENLIQKAKAANLAPLGVEGLDSGEWVLVDLHDVVVHVMQPRVREFYKLEDIWNVGAEVAAGAS